MLSIFSPHDLFPAFVSIATLVSTSLPSASGHHALTHVLKGVLTNIFVMPFEKLTEMTHRVGETASLHLIARLSIPDILGPITDSTNFGGLHIDEIAAEADIPPSKLAGPLRLLTTSGWFDEVEEDVFRNTKMSNQLRDGSDAYCWVRSSYVYSL